MDTFIFTVYTNKGSIGLMPSGCSAFVALNFIIYYNNPVRLSIPGPAGVNFIKDFPLSTITWSQCTYNHVFVMYITDMEVSVHVIPTTNSMIIMLSAKYCCMQSSSIPCIVGS